MATQQYDVDQQTRRIYEEKAKRREVLREQFLKQRTNPFRHATGEGGTVFDPALMRYQAMKVSAWEYFKPSAINRLYGLGLLVGPMVLFGYILKKQRDGQEAKYRTGQVAYKDRRFKFI